MSESGASTTNAGDPVPGDRSSRRTWLSYLVFAAALVAIVGTIMVRARRPELTPEEREHLGTWYGYIDEGERHYCWLTRLRRDRTCDISFRNYYPFSNEDVAAGASRFAYSEVSESRGTWRINGTDYVTETWYPENDPGTLPRLWVWLRDQQWLPRSLLTYSYHIEEATADHFVYTLNSEAVTFHAVRVPDDFELPRQPLDNDVALALWRRLHGTESPVEEASP